jgi:GT2 family glycosyltransferase
MISPATYGVSGSAESRSKAIRQSRRHAGFGDRRLGRGLSIVILNLNKPELIGPLLNRLEREREAFSAAGLDLQILIGDTGSTDPATLNHYASAGNSTGIEVVTGLRYHFSANNNDVAFARARNDALLFLNNDVIPPDDRLPFLEMRQALDQQPDLGVVGACLWFPDGTVQHAGIAFMPTGERRGLPFHPLAGEKLRASALPAAKECAAVTGACLMIRSALFARIGGFDEAYAREAQDIDLCLCAGRLGQRTTLMNVGHLIHIENATRPKGEADTADRALFLRRWFSYLEAFDL